MNRRDFFKLGIASAAAVAALKGFADDYEIPSQPTSESAEYFGDSELLTLSAYGVAKKPGPIGYLKMMRKGMPGAYPILLQIPIDAFGGSFLWVPPAEIRPISTPEGPLVFVKSGPDIFYEATFKRGDRILVVAG